MLMYRAFIKEADVHSLVVCLHLALFGNNLYLAYHPQPSLVGRATVIYS